MNRHGLSIWLTALLLTFSRLGVASTVSVPADVEKAVLNEDWRQVADLCADNEAMSASPALRAIKGHACLALNRNNQSLLLFLSLASEEERQTWLSWTSAFAENNPGASVALYLKGDALARTGNWDAALACYDRALSKDDKGKLALNARGVAYAGRADWDRARTDLEKACNSAKEFAEAYASLGNLQLMRHASKGALRSYSEALRINPEFAVALNGRACANFGELEWAKANEDFAEAGRLLPLPLFLGNLRALSVAAENLHAPGLEKSPLFRFSDFLDWETLQESTMKEEDVLRTLLGAPLPESLDGEIVDKMNRALETPDFYDRVKDRLDLDKASKEMLSLVERTKKHRSEEFVGAVTGNLELTLSLNRLVIELAYPHLIAQHAQRDPGMQLAVQNGQIYHGDKLEYMRSLSNDQIFDGQNRVQNLWRPMADFAQSMPLVGSLGQQWNRHLDTANTAAGKRPGPLPANIPNRWRFHGNATRFRRSRQLARCELVRIGTRFARVGRSTMRGQTMRNGIRISLLCFLVCLPSASLIAEGFMAFSLREAQNRTRLGLHTKELRTLAGITRVAGAVYDKPGRDIVLVGRVVDGLPECRLDDLVVALRSRLVLDEWPTVSIDPTDKTPITRRQAVTFHGGLVGTALGEDFLDCDVILKNYSLGLLHSVPEVQTYRDLAEERMHRNVAEFGQDLEPFTWLSSTDATKVCEGLRGRPVTGESTCQVQFWFFGREPFHVKFSEDVFCIEELELIVNVKVMTGHEETGFAGSRSTDLVEAGKEFAEQFTGNLSRVAAAHPVLKRLKVFYDLVAISEGIRSTGSCADLDYFLKQYPISTVATKGELEQVDLFGIAENPNGSRHFLCISGGIRFETQLKWLNDGDVTPLRQIVLETRPDPNALSWTLPLEEWRMPNGADLAPKNYTSDLAPKAGNFERTGVEGCTFNLQSVSLGPESPLMGNDLRKRFSGLPPFPPPPPPLKGVSMRMRIDSSSYKEDDSGQMESLRENLLRDRGSKDNLTWPTDKSEEKE
jgi:tetratricopeptide (TPR) repeat protein